MMVSETLQPVPPAPELGCLPQAACHTERVAVLLNRNARRVGDRLAQHARSVAGADNVFSSGSLEEAETLCREIVQRGYGTVVCGGGDGTLVRSYNLIQRYVDESNAWRLERYRRFGELQNRLSMPRFAFLSLGTGNGLRRVAGAGDPWADLRTLVDTVPTAERQVSLIEGPRDRFTFGGMGYDAMLLNDYNALRARARGRLARATLHSLAGYFIAALGRTLPRVLAGQHKLVGRVVTLTRAYYIDPRRGDAVCPIEAGSTLYEGPMGMLGFGTTPFFGYGFRVFPFASLVPSKMHLRVARLGPLQTLGNLPALWAGHYRNSSQLLDFLVSDVRITLAGPQPFQHSGDDQGLTQDLRLRVADETLRLVDLYRHNPQT